VAPYAGLLDLALVVADLGITVWLWCRDAIEPRLVALPALAVGLAGQILAKTIGLPGASGLNGTPGPWETVGGHEKLPVGGHEVARWWP
jgi:hypothetical protein